MKIIAQFAWTIVFCCLTSVAFTAKTNAAPPETATASAGSSAPSYSTALNAAWQAFQVAQLHAFLNHKLAVQKQIQDDQVAAVGMGRREAARMMEMHAIQGVPYDQADTDAVAAAYKKAQDDARAAYKTYEATATADQKTAAKKLYVAWLTYIQTMMTYQGNPIMFDQNNPVAATAYHNAENEFQVDSM